MATVAVRAPFSFPKLFGEKKNPKAVQVCGRLAPKSDDDDSRWGDCPTKSPKGCLLPPQAPKDKGKLVVCLDLDETLLHCRMASRPGYGLPISSEDEPDCSSCFVLEGELQARQLLKREARRMSPLCQTKLIQILEGEGLRTVADLRLLSLKQWADLVNKTSASIQIEPAVELIYGYDGLDAPAVKAALKFLEASANSKLTVGGLPAFLSSQTLQHPSSALPAAVIRFLQKVIQESSLESVRCVIDRLLEFVHTPKPRSLPKPHDKLFAQGKEFNVWLRPHVLDFMKRLGELPCEVVVFTASLPEYADPLIGMIDPTGVTKHRLYRDAVQRSSTGMAKDLSLLGRSLQRVVLVDNADYALALNPDNGIRVNNFHGFVGDDDDELLRVLAIIEGICEESDVRSRIREEAEQWSAAEIGDPSRLSRRFRERVEGRSAPPVTPCPTM